jgi:ATP synthase protein I
MDDDLQKKLGHLEDRIKTARSNSQEHGTIEKEGAPQKENPEAVKSGRAGSEFLANIIAGWVIGFVIDWFFLTKPWGIIIFMILGFVSGVYRADRVMKKNGK